MQVIIRPTDSIQILDNYTDRRLLATVTGQEVLAMLETMGQVRDVLHPSHPLNQLEDEWTYGNTINTTDTDTDAG